VIVGFLHNDNPRERILAEAVLTGCRLVGDTAWMVSKAEAKADGYQKADVYAMVGVKSAEIFHEIMRGGAHVLYFDKGYLRHIAPNGPRVWEYWRVCLDAQHPTEAELMVPFPLDRYLSWNKPAQPWRKTGSHIVFAGSSEKYHNFHGLMHPTEYASRLVKTIRKSGLSTRDIVYRPKPSWRAAEPVRGASFSDQSQSIADVLQDAWCLITHGSNAALDAIITGVPCIILGDGVAKVISSTELSEIENPRLASDEERMRWLSAVAWQQFTLAEMASGLMWSHIRPRILR
jgi:hypothetical protein